MSEISDLIYEIELFIRMLYTWHEIGVADVEGHLSFTPTFFIPSHSSLKWSERNIITEIAIHCGCHSSVSWQVYIYSCHSGLLEHSTVCTENHLFWCEYFPHFSKQYDNIYVILNFTLMGYFNDVVSSTIYILLSIIVSCEKLFLIR